ncbi:MAG: carboxypeptidase-like regulatory domain-containing protein, partial [Candidatus Diapherotrites archaeon]
MADALKNFYYGMEDGYYAFLDKVDKVIPIYKIVDPIDKVVPSFAIVFLIGILIVLGLLFYFVLPLIAGPGVMLTFAVEDEDGNPVSGANVVLTVNGQPLTYVSSGQGGVPPVSATQGSTVHYEVTATGFDGAQGDHLAETDAVVTVTLAASSSDTGDKTIRLISPGGTVLVGEATLSFSCTNASAVAPNDKTIYNGVTTVTPPANCGTLLVNVRAVGYQNIDSQPYSTPDIQLQAIDGAKGSITASVTYNGAGVAAVTIAVYQNNLLVQEKQTDATGNAVLDNISAGTGYTLQSRATSIYGAQTSTSFSVSAGQNIPVTLQLERNVSATLKIIAKEENSTTRVSKATISIWQGSNQLDIQTSDSNGEVTFNLSDTGAYTVTVDHNDYLIVQKVVTIPSAGSFTETIELQKWSGEKAGVLTVEVLEQDSGRGVKNAKVFLYDSDTNFLTGYAAQYTDINGLARFPNVSDGGRFFAAAIKEGSIGYSDPERFLVREQDSFKLQVSLAIPNGTIRVKVTNKEGESVYAAQVSIYDSYNDSLLGSSLTDSNGEFILPSTNRYAKADKTVYVKVFHEDYASYTTTEKQILANSVQNFNVILEPKLIQGNADINFAGLYSGDKSVLNVAAGKTYTAKFKIRIPEGQTYDSPLVHVRVGKNENGIGILEKDNSAIKSVNAPGASIVKGTSFDPSNGSNEDLQYLTAGDAKWANLEWSSLSSGVYEVEETVSVNKTASTSEVVKFFYRFEGDFEGTYRNPTDSTVSDGFYAKTSERTYSISTSSPLCDSDFCFAATIYDQNTKLAESVIDSYNAHVFNDYTLNFNLANNSAYKIYSNIILRIENKDKGLQLQTYSVNEATTNKLFEGSFSDNKIDLSEMGEMDNGNKISGELKYKTVKSGNSILSFQVIADNTIVFSKDIQVNSAAMNSFKVTANPLLLPAGISNTVDVNVVDTTTNLEVENALVTLKDRFGEVVGQATTDKLGQASVIAPAIYPNETLTLVVEKSDYAPSELTLSADPNTLAFDPETLSISLNARTQSQNSATVEVENKAAFPLVLSLVRYSGNSNGLLNEDSINNGLYAFQGITLQPGDKQLVTLTSYLSPEGLQLQDREQLEGSLEIYASNFGQNWSFDVPVKTTIGVGAEVDNENCLIVTQTDWQTSTEGSVRDVQFKIQNNCTVSGNPVQLDDLQVEADWQGNVIGTYLLSLYTSGSSAVTAAAEPRAGYFKTLVSQVPAGQEYSAILQFTPQGGVQGTAKADIIVRATNKTSGAKDQVLSQTIKTSINIINLQSCISYSKELMIINKTSQQTDASTDFTISNKEGCGEIKLFLNSDLELSTSELSLADGATSPTISVLAADNWPGQYSIEVQAQPQGVTQKSAITSYIEKDHFLRVRIYNTDDCLQLNRYEYDVYKDAANPDTTGFDNGELVNNCYEKDVSVKVDTKSFSNALKEGIKWGVVTLVAGLVAQQMEGWKIGGYKVGQNYKGVGTVAGVAGNVVQVQTPKGDYLFYNTSTNAQVDKATWDTALKATVTNTNNVQTSTGTYTVSEGPQNVFTIRKGDVVIGTLDKQTSTFVPEPGIDSSQYKQDQMNDIVNTFEDQRTAAQVGEDAQRAAAGEEPSAGGSFVLSPSGNAVLSPTGNLFENSGILSTIGSFLIPGGGGFLGGAFGSSPWSQALGVTIMTAMQSYFSSETLSYTVQKPDLDINNLIVLKGGTADETLDSDVSVREIGQRELEASTASTKDIQKIGIQFFNDSSFTGTLYKLFKVDGGRHEYKESKTYKLDDIVSSGLLETSSASDIDADDIQLEETNDSPKYDLYKFHVQFNAISPEELVNPDVSVAADCASYAPPGLAGDTGENASYLPKLLFKWSWADVDSDQCDSSNPNYVYCDATQFAIETLQKVQIVREFLENNRTLLKCPTSAQQLSGIDYTVGNADIGIDQVTVSKPNATDVNILVKLKNSNAQSVVANVKVTLTKEGDSAGNSKTEIVSVSKDATVGLAFSGLTSGSKYNYSVEVSYENCSASSCNTISADDVGSNGFTVGYSGSEVCEPYTTMRLADFIEATEGAGINLDWPQGAPDKTSFLNTLHYSAHLIKDRYSPDFHADFDRYANDVGFFEAPETYTSQTDGLGLYFKDFEKFKFVPKYGGGDATGYVLPSPGLYEVDLNISFEDSSWQFFEDGSTSASIRVLLNKSPSESDDVSSPFYYLPVDGLIGTTSEDNGRTGYGVAFSGEVVNINSDSAHQVDTEGVATSSPYEST